MRIPVVFAEAVEEVVPGPGAGELREILEYRAGDEAAVVGHGDEPARKRGRVG